MKYQVLRVTPSNIREIISAVELDLRGMIVLYLGSQKETPDLLGSELWKKCSEHQQAERGFISKQLQEVLAYVDFGDLYQLLNTHRSLLPSQVAKHLKDITPQLEKLVPVRNRIAHNRTLYYDDCERTESFVQMILNEQEALWDHVKTDVTRFERAQSLKDTKKIHNLPSPEYDETGYIGRKYQVDELKRLCLQSSFPVISVIGDGGVGKTSLALKVVYDIVESPDCPFDFIVWTSSKTKQLTTQEIKNIENAISSSGEMFQNVSDHLAPKGMNNPFQEILTYLSNFKILLILDNLETILDEQIRQFLGNLPPGSKVLITSRIGVGAYEAPIRLKPLDIGESVQLLRALAKTCQISHLFKMSDSRLGKICDQMNNNPLFIKWFVLAVQTGKRPEEVLDKRDLLLEFCMSNVYNFLSEDSHRILNSLLCIPGQHSQAMIAYLNEMDPITLGEAIRQLDRTTMITMSSNVKDASLESKYELSELARDYLSKHHPVPPEEDKNFKRKLRQLIAELEYMNTDLEEDPFSFYTIQRRSESDLIVAKYLREALTCARHRKFTEAEESIGKARNLAPEFFEVFRVEANVKAQQRNYSAAREAYEAAIELNPQSAPLRYWYAGFLMRYDREMEEALKQFKEAYKLDSKSAEIQIEIVRASLYSRRYDETRAGLDELLRRADQIKVTARRKVYDLNLQYYKRKAEDFSSQRDKAAAFCELEQLRDAYINCPPDLIDGKMKERVEDTGSLIRTCVSFMENNQQFRGRAEQLLEWFNKNFVSVDTIEAKYELKESLKGIVDSFFVERGYGFIFANNGQKFFFRRRDLANSRDWNRLQKNSQVIFWQSRFPDGSTPHAENVTLV